MRDGPAPAVLVLGIAARNLVSNWLRFDRMPPLARPRSIFGQIAVGTSRKLTCQRRRLRRWRVAAAMARTSTFIWSRVLDIVGASHNPVGNRPRSGQTLRSAVGQITAGVGHNLARQRHGPMALVSQFSIGIGHNPTKNQLRFDRA